MILNDIIYCEDINAIAISYGGPCTKKFTVIVFIDENVVCGDIPFSLYKDTKWIIAKKKERIRFAQMLKKHGLMIDNKKLVNWKAKFGEYYYYVSEFGTIECKKEDNYFEDKRRYNIGNYFPTKILCKPLAKSFIYWLNCPR